MRKRHKTRKLTRVAKNMIDISNKMKVTLNKFLTDDVELLIALMQETQNHPEYIPENGVKHMVEIIDSHYSALKDRIELLQEQTKLDVLKNDIVANCPNGITVSSLAKKLSEIVSKDFIQLVIKGIRKYFDENGICATVYEDEQIVINFSTAEDENEKADIVIMIEEAIENKYTYNMPTLVEGAISALLYKSLQK